jgi:PAS domain S-box-containing protein
MTEQLTRSQPETPAAGPAATSLERFRGLAAGFPDAFLWEADAQTLDYTMVSPSAERLLGYPVDQCMEPGFLLRHIHSDDRDDVIAAHRRANETGVDSDIEYRMIAADGRLVWLRDRAIRIQDGDGRAVEIRGCAMDVTAQKRAERRLAIQYDVSEALAESNDLNEVAARILRSVCESKGWKFGALWVVDQADGVLRCVDAWCVPDIDGEEFRSLCMTFAFKPGVGLPGRVWADKKACWLPDVLADGNFPRAPAAVRLGLRAGVAAPIMWEEQCLGVIEFFNDSVQPPDDDVIAVFRAIGRQVGQFIERKRALTSLEESERRYRDLVAALDVAVYTTDAEGRVTQYNDAAVNLWGRRPEIGKDLWCGSWRLYWPDGRPMSHDECPMAITLKENRPVRGAEAIAERPDGTRIAFAPYPTPLRDSAGKLVGAVNVMIDITSQKKATELLRLSEQRYKALFESNPDAVFSLDLQGTFTSANPACERVSGYSIDELIGSSFTRFVGPMGVKQAIEQFAEVVRGEEQTLQVTIRRKDGHEVDLSLTGLPISIEGTTIGIYGIAKDITERNRAEAALRESEEQHRLALEAGRMGSWEWIVATNEVRWSEGLELIHGLAPGTFAGTFEAFLSDMHPEDIERVQLDIGNSLAQGSHEIEYRIIVPDGRVRWVLGKGQVIYDESGQASRMIGVCMDITERKRAEERLERAIEAKDEFLSLISHELRTPITTIYGGARLLGSRGDALDDESRREVLADIEQETDRLRRIVEDLLVLSRLEYDQPIMTEPVLVQRIAERVADAARKRGRRVDINVPSDFDAVAADATYLEQVLRNLVSNADKYSPAGSPILITARHLNGEALISVLDEGRGVPVDEADRIFDRFYRSEQNDSHIGGAGIGLAVCRRLIEAQSGRIWAGPRESGGLTVSFTLPLSREESL